MSDILKSRRMTLAFTCIIIYAIYIVICNVMDAAPDQTLPAFLQAITYICIGSKVQQSNGTYT